MMTVKRGDIYYADLSPVVGSEQGGLRPVLIIQNDVGNRYSPTVIAAAITSRMGKTRLPTHIDIYADKAGLSKDSVILSQNGDKINRKCIFSQKFNPKCQDFPRLMPRQHRFACQGRS